MTTVSLDKLLPHVLPEVPGCPSPLVKSKIRTAVIDFCEQTLAWNHDMTAIDLVANQSNYTLDLPVPPTFTAITDTLTDDNLSAGISTTTESQSWMSPDGLSLFTMYYSSANFYIRKATLSKAGVVSSIGVWSDLVSFSTNTNYAPVEGFWFSADGLKLIVICNARAIGYTFGTAFDIDGTITFSEQSPSFSVTAGLGYSISGDNKYMYAFWNPGNDLEIHQFSIGDVADASTYAYVQKFSYNSIFSYTDGTIRGVTPNYDGTKLFIMIMDNANNFFIRENTMGAGHDLAALIYKSLTQINNISASSYTRLQWAQDGTKLYVHAVTDKLLKQFSTTLVTGGVTEVQVVAVKTLFDDGEEIDPMSEAAMDLESPLDTAEPWRGESDNQASYYYQPNQSQVRLVPIPDTAKTGGLTGKIAVKPLPNGTQIDEDLYNQYYEELAAGAKALLMLMPEQDWSNPKLGAYYATSFQSGVTKATGKDVRSNQQTTKTVGRTKVYS